MDRNGFGLSIAEAEEEVRLIEREFGFLPDNRQIHAVWRRLVYDHGVRGRQVHDARLVAVMRVYGLSHLQPAVSSSSGVTSASVAASRSSEASQVKSVPGYIRRS
jgi:hypothetical protein